MSNVIITPNMNLPNPVPSVDPGPDYANNLSNALNVIDEHTHVPGQGVPVPPAGLNINADLPFQNNNLTGAKSVRFQPQPSALSGAMDLGAIYVVGPDLYYNDGSGNQVKITTGGSVNAGAGSISGLPSGTASVAYSGGTYTFQSATATSAVLDLGSAILRDNTASSKGLTLSPPNSMAADYTITLPPLPSVTSFLTIDASGTVASTTPSTAVSNNYSTHQFQLNGKYATLNVPASEIDGFCFFNYNATLLAAWVYNVTPGSGGTTEFDLKVASPGGSFATILSTTGKITSAAAANSWTDSNSVVGVQTGVTKPVVSNATINAGQAIRFDILQTQTGLAADCGVVLQFIPR